MPETPTGHRPALPAAPVLRDGTDLLLRRHRPDDADGVHEQCQDPEMARFTTVAVPYTRQHAEEFLAEVARGWEAGTTAAFAIEVEGRFAGTVDLRLQEAAWAEVGFGLAPWARRRGVMTRALGLLVDWGFEELGLVGVQWQARVGNEGSRRAAERCGFRVEGEVRGLLVLRGERFDGWIGTVLAADRRAPPASAAAGPPR